MRRCVLILVAGMLALAAIPAAGAVMPGPVTSTKVSVTPGAGGPRTMFRFRFRAPDLTGVGAGWSRVNTLSVGGPTRAGCVSDGTTTLPPSVAGTMVRVTMNPAHLGGRWCVGTFRGEIIDSQRIICDPKPVEACPQLVIAPQVIARFTFRVTRTS
jgi:hypothetical protein